MRKLLFILLLIPIFALAKDPCLSIKRHEDKMRGFVSYTSPDGPMVVNKWVTANDTSLSITFTIKSPAQEVMLTKGLFVEFEDGTYFRRDTVVVDKMDIAGKQVYGYRLVLDKATTGLFTSTRVRQFGLGGFTMKVSDVADRVPEFLICMSKPHQ